MASVNITIIESPKAGCASGNAARAPREGLRGGRYRRFTLAERLAARTVVDSVTGCWNIQGCRVGPNGYGQIMRDATSRQLIYAHRAAWEVAHGSIPDDLKVLHHCDNPRCVNPSHLFLGTQTANVRDCSAKRRRDAFGIQKLHPPQVREIRALAAQRHLTYRQIGQRFGVAKSTVKHIVAGRAWAWLTDVDTVCQPVFERVPSRQLPILGEVA